MPRGVPKAGFRNTAAAVARGGVIAPAAIMTAPRVAEVFETDAQIYERIAERFEILDTLTSAACTGDVRAVIVSGPPGLGKSYGVEQVLKAHDPEGNNTTTVKGFVRATGLYKVLYQNRLPGQVLVFDDADSIFFDDITLNLLKGVCDSTDVRRVSWLAETRMVDEESAELMPRSFEFEGTIIFITNLDFDLLIEKGHKLAPHLEAMVSRAHYIDLAMKTKRDYLVRIAQVVKLGMLKDNGYNQTAEDEVLAFINANVDRMRELSLRMVLKVAAVRKVRMGGAGWERMARVTCCKN